MLDPLRQRLHRRRHPARYAELARLLVTQAQAPEAVLAAQRRGFWEMVAHAAANTPYYAETLGPLLGRGAPLEPQDLPVLS